MSDARPPESDEPSEDDMYTRPLGAGIDFADLNSRLAPLYFGVSGVLATALLAAVFLFYASLPLNHTDVWVHLKYGQRIVETRQLPDTEPFSPFTDKETNLVNAQWLSQVLYAAAFRAGEALHGGPADAKWLGGAELLRALHAVAVTAFLGLIGLAVRRASGFPGLAVVAMALLAVAMLPVGTHRPQTFGLVGYAAVLALVSPPVPSRRVAWLTPLVMALWANLHGSFVIGFILLGIVLVGRGIDAARAAGWSVSAVRTDVGVRRILIGTALSLAAVLVNPYGPKLVMAVLTFGSNPNLKTLMEWTPLRPFEPSLGTIVFWALLVGNLVVFGVGFRSLSAVRVLVVMAFAAAVLLQQRMIVWWIPVGVWAFVSQLGAILRTRGVVLPGVVPNLKLTILSLLLAVPILLLSPLFQWLQRGGATDPKKVVHPGTPNELVAVLRNPAVDPGERMRPLAAFLRERYAGQPVGPVFGAEGVGEFLLWADVPGCPPLFFTHAHLFSPEHWQASQTVLNGESGWREILDRAGVNLVAVEPDIRGRLAGLIARDPDWQVVLNEAGGAGRDVRGRLFVAVRKQPK